MTPINSGAQMAALAQHFFDLSNAVSDYRLNHYNDLTSDQRDGLKVQSQLLASRGQQFTADALGIILKEIQPHLADIQNATAGAKDALAKLNTVAKAITIVDAAVALSTAIGTHNLATLPDQIQGLCAAFTA